MTEPRAYAERTIAAYRVHAAKAARSWSRLRGPSRFLREFAEALPRGSGEGAASVSRVAPAPRHFLGSGEGAASVSRVLDYGCGIGTEMVWLRRRGFRVEGVDATLEFVRAARRRCPGVPVAHARFETVSLPAGRYDGIWCNAALLHVPPSELARQLGKLARAARPGGLLGLTLAWGRAKRFTRCDWIPGRYFACYRLAEAAALLRGWELLEGRVVCGDGRQGRWIQLLGSCHNKER